MRAVLGAVMAVLFGVAFSGCVVTTKNVEVERADQSIAGNRGFFKGTPPTVESRKATRQHIDVDVELPRVSREARSFEVKDTITKGSSNSYSTADPAPEVVTETLEDIEGVSSAPEEAEVIEEEVVQPVKESPRETVAPIVEVATPSKKYIVQKNDTLEKIAAKPEIYGDGKKWYSIYKANKDKLKSPDKIRPGQELTIPPVEKTEKGIAK